MRKVLYILGQFEDEDVVWLGKAGKRLDLSAQQMLIEQDKPLDKVYILLRGSLTVLLGGKPIAELEPGEIVGEMSLIDKRLASATVAVTQGACVLAIEQAVMADKLQHDFKFAARFYRAIAMFLSSRLRATTIQFGETVANAARGDADAPDAGFPDDPHRAGIRFEQILDKLRSAAA